MTPVLRRILRPFDRFFSSQALGGVLLAVATVVALLWANSAWSQSYLALWATPVTLGAPSFGLSKALSLWVNDLLMAVFFLLVGLEIKREILLGELNSWKKALLPICAAIGGMVVPALVFSLVASDAPANRGWGIPMATDIAFALACLRMLGSRVPSALIVFLTAVAIIDDLGAIVVIAAAYSSGVAWLPLLIAAACIAALVGMNRAGVRRPVWYLLVGIPLWVAVLKSGIHATIAGVIIGLSLPARAGSTRADIVGQAERFLAEARSTNEADEEGSNAALTALERSLEQHESPLTRLEHALHPIVAYFVVPVFALCNAGIDLRGISASDLAHPVALGIVLGLVVGKQIGVFGASYLAVRFGLAELPNGVRWRHVYGAAWLAGIGFTMSLFIASLAFGEGSMEHSRAKLGILLGSLIAAVGAVATLAPRGSGVSVGQDGVRQG